MCSPFSNLPSHQKLSVIPFGSQDQLNFELDIPDAERKWLPGNPRIMLSDSVKLNAFISKDFDLADLEELSSHLWLMSKPDSGNISPLHRQLVKGRKIIITEDIRLHLVWHYDRIFVKPLPRYMTSHTFLSEYLLLCPSKPTNLLLQHERIRKAALGHLRTYSYLITHESDFDIAQEARLIPREVSWIQLAGFLEGLENIRDSQVAGRFQYGEIRLTRLNFYSKFILRKFYFQRVHNQYGAYFERFYGPLLFTFGMLSLLLNAMQVEMSVEQVYSTTQWLSFWRTCRGFSVMCLFLVVILSLWLALLFLYKFTMEWVYALTQHRNKKYNNIKVDSELA